LSLGLALVVIVVLFLLIKSAGFRKAALVMFGLLALGAFLLYVWITRSDNERARKDEQAKTLIKLNEVEVIDPRLSFSTYDGRQPDKLIGRIRNNSRYPIEELEFSLTFRDCNSDRNCEIIGESNPSVFISVPPGQSRDFSTYVSGGQMVPRGKLEWQYSLKGVEASIP